MMRIILGLVLVFMLTGAVWAGAVPDQPHVVVSGQSEVSVVPDILHISLNLTEVGQEVAVARDQVEKRSQKLIDTLMQQGVEKRDITAASLKITPHYNWKNKAQIYVGTEVSRQVEVTLRDLAKYDDLIRAIIEAKVARVNSTRLESSREKELRNEALQMAIADARQKAELLVASFPEKLGPVYAITSGGPIHRQREAYAMASVMSRKAAFEPGEIEISESVQVVFYLVQ
jgi:uncharacterized protein YggE